MKLKQYSNMPKCRSVPVVNATDGYAGGCVPDDGKKDNRSPQPAPSPARSGPVGTVRTRGLTVKPPIGTATVTGSVTRLLPPKPSPPPWPAVFKQLVNQNFAAVDVFNQQSHARLMLPGDVVEVLAMPFGHALQGCRECLLMARFRRCQGLLVSLD